MGSIQADGRDMADSRYQVWSAETDTLPRLIAGPDDDSVDVILSIGAWSAGGEELAIEVTVTVDGAAATPAALRAGRWGDHELGRVSPKDLGAILAAEQSVAWHARPVGLDEDRRWFMEMAQRAADHPGNRYYQVIVPGVRAGCWLEYTCTAALGDQTAAPHDQEVAGSCRFGLYASAPTFGADDLRSAYTPGGEGCRAEDDATWWVLFHRRESGFDHFRVDLLTPQGLSSERPDLVVEVGADRLEVGAARPGEGGGPVWLPLIDLCADTVTFSCPAPGPTAGRTPGPASGPLPAVHLTRGGVRSAEVDLGQQTQAARTLLVNYAIQGLNDLFEVPADGRSEESPQPTYNPPRTYAQITVLDDAGVYSSRPFRDENGEPDGYEYSLAAQREFAVKSHWAFNAGLLLLLAHDSPDTLETLRQDVATGLVSASNAGFGAHRPPYYTARTNLEELTRGAAIIERLLGRCDGVYYPDQRLYECTTAETDSYTAFAASSPHLSSRYLVLDRSTVCYRTDDGTQVRYFPPGTSGETWTAEQFAVGNRLWQDGPTGYRLLLIEDDLRDHLFGQSPEELARGTLPLALRRMFMRALTDRSPQRPLFVYADDADKGAGSGWFDGLTDYTGRGLVFTNRYQAALAWIARHPWVQAITTQDLDDDPGAIGDLTVSSATCPSVDPLGAATSDWFGHRLHFDLWHEDWARTESPWLGKSLGTLLEAVEEPLVEATAEGFDRDLLDLAWASFLLSTHEQFWGTQALESGTVNQDRHHYPPEDFVIAESLQMRNALVYLNAARWARLAGDELDDATYVDEGWLLDAVPDRKWDGDLLTNVLVYNRLVLLVLERNGGCISHVFVRDAGRAYCVSGTPKAYQWFGPVEVDGQVSRNGQFGRNGQVGGRQVHDHPPLRWYSCDGTVLQNTVWTPNHAYVAADSALARPRLGRRYDDRAGDRNPLGWLFPNNFDEYEALSGDGGVTFSYQAGTDEPPAGPDELTDQYFEKKCQQDRVARVYGEGTRVIWHDPGQVGLRKTIRLSGQSISVTYQAARPGHVVSNEFCAHLQAALLGGRFHQKEASADGLSIRLRGADGVQVGVSLLDGCEFTPAALLTGPVPDLHQESDRLRLHRVLTDNLEIRCPGGGDFSYRIDLSCL